MDCLYCGKYTIDDSDGDRLYCNTDCYNMDHPKPGWISVGARCHIETNTSNTNTIFSVTEINKQTVKLNNGQFVPFGHLKQVVSYNPFGLDDREVCFEVNEEDIESI